MNEYGMTVTLNTTLNRLLSYGEVDPILSVNREVLEDAKTLDEALTIYRSYKYMSGWLVQIADARGQAGVVELSGSGVSFFPSKPSGVSALSNSYQSETQRQTEIGLTPGVVIHNRDRLNRLYDLAESQMLHSSGLDSIQIAAQILSDSYSPYSNTHVVYTTSGIRTLEQVMSIIFVPTEGSVWVSDDASAPTSLTSKYTRFSFESMEEAVQSGAPLVPEFYPIHSFLALPGKSLKENQSAMDALKEFVSANAEVTQRNDKLSAYQHLKKAVALSPDCSFELYLGSYALHFGLKNLDAEDLEIAQVSLAKAIACPILNAHQKAIGHYLNGILTLQQLAFKEAIRNFDDANALESDLKSSLGVDPDSSLLSNINYYKKMAIRQRSGVGRWLWYNPNVLLEMKIADRPLGWNL
jgi:hypothetical protein